jgi:hypothetical protein
MNTRTSGIRPASTARLRSFAAPSRPPYPVRTVRQAAVDTERVDHARDERVLRADLVRARLRGWRLALAPSGAGWPVGQSLLDPPAISVPSESSPESLSPACSGEADVDADAECSARLGSCVWENALLPWLLSCPADQKPLPLRTSPLRGWWWWPWVVVDGVVVVERDEEAEGPLAMGVGDADHPEDWKYSCVGAESAAAPSAPQ